MSVAGRSDDADTGGATRPTRRRLLGGLAAGAAAAAFPTIVPARALGLDGAVAPSERITLA